MSAPPPELTAYHLGLVVRDMDEVIELYTRMLGVSDWKRADLATPSGTTHLAFGRRAGLTFELLHIDEPHGLSESLRERGEGLHHIGYWTPYLKETLTRARSDGARPVTLSRNPDGTVAVQMSA